MLQFLYIQSSNRSGKFYPRISFSRLDTFAVIDIQPPNNALFLRLMFPTSPIDFENVFMKSDIASNVNWYSWLGMSSIRVPHCSLWRNTYFSSKKLFH